MDRDPQFIGSCDEPGGAHIVVHELEGQHLPHRPPAESQVTSDGALIGEPGKKGADPINGPSGPHPLREGKERTEIQREDFGMLKSLPKCYRGKKAAHHHRRKHLPPRLGHPHLLNHLYLE